MGTQDQMSSAELFPCGEDNSQQDENESITNSFSDSEFTLLSPAKAPFSYQDRQKTKDSVQWDFLVGQQSRGNQSTFIPDSQDTKNSVIPAWVPDSHCNICTNCGKRFSLIFRRHHCRLCGRIFCLNCASSFCLLPEKFGEREPQRVCTSCKAFLEPFQDELAAKIALSTRYIDPRSRSTVGQWTFALNPYSFSLSAEIEKAAIMVDSFCRPDLTDGCIPASLIRSATGICFLTVAKGGFLMSARFGTGLVIARDHEGFWTAPSAIGLLGVGWGAQLGGEITTFMIFLNSQAAVDTFSSKGQINLGSQVGVVAGPLGRKGEINFGIGDRGVAPCFSYSQSKGMFVGISLEGAVLSERPAINDRFYGKHYEPEILLSGTVSPPRAAYPLYDKLRKAELEDSSQKFYISDPQKLLSS